MDWNSLTVELIRALGPTLLAVGGIVGIVVQNRRTHERVRRVEGEVTHNGGSSMKDAIARIEDGLSTVHRRMDEHLADCAQQGRRRR